MKKLVLFVLTAILLVYCGTACAYDAIDPSSPGYTEGEFTTVADLNIIPYDGLRYDLTINYNMVVLENFLAAEHLAGGIHSIPGYMAKTELTTSDDLTQGSTNIYATAALMSGYMQKAELTDSDDLTEGSTNLYVTAANVGGISANIAADGTIEWEDATALDAGGDLVADIVAAAEMADADHGDITWSSGTATLDADVVAAAEMADADHGDVAWSSGVATVQAVSGANSVDSDAYVDASIDLAHMSSASVDSDNIVNGTIAVGDMAANSVDSDQYVDASIDNAHLAANIITEAEIDWTQFDEVFVKTITDTLDLTEDAVLPLWYNIYGTTMTISAIYCVSDIDDCDFTLKESNSGTDFGTTSTVESIAVDSDGTSVYYKTLTSGIDDAAIAAGNWVLFDNNATDEPGYLAMAIGFNRANS